MEIKLDSMVDRLAALAQPHRLAVFRLLVVAGPAGRAAGEIAESVGLPASSLSFHLAHLKRAGLVTVARDGRTLTYAADFAVMRGLVDFLVENCCTGGNCAAGSVVERNVA